MLLKAETIEYSNAEEMNPYSSLKIYNFLISSDTYTRKVHCLGFNLCVKGAHKSNLIYYKID